MRIGLELEYWVIDREGELSSAKKISGTDFTEQEFVEPLLEIKTRPHKDLDNLEGEIKNKISSILETAEEEGLKIVPLGTPLNSGRIKKISSKRGEIQREIVGERLQAAKRVAGTHIHFEKENVKNQLNILTALDPALALLNSSPYYKGESISSSSRNKAYRHHCYKELSGHGQLWKYTDSIDEWKQRVEKKFQEFKEAGKKNGITEEEIKEHFSAEDALWTPVRLRSRLPTVEWRSPDTAKPCQVIKLVRESKKIVEKASEKGLNTEDGVEVPKFKKVQELSDKAIKEGMKSSEVIEYLEKLGFSPENYTDISEKWREGEKISMEKASKIRLEAAEGFRRSFYENY